MNTSQSRIRLCNIRRLEGFSARNRNFTVAEIVKRHNDAAGGFGCFDSTEFIAVTGVAGSWRYNIVKNINAFRAVV